MNIWSQWMPKIAEGRRAQRQAIIWRGVLHNDGRSTTVKVRNVSTTGAMIQSTTPLEVGSQCLLELSDGVSIAATVQWADGEQAGLGFQAPFDLALLAQSKPIAVQRPWSPPVYLDRAVQAAWERRIRRLSPAELRAEFKEYVSD